MLIRDGSCYLKLTVFGNGILDIRLAGQVGRTVQIAGQHDNLNKALDQMRVTPLSDFSGFCNLTITLERVLTNERVQNLVGQMSIVEHIPVFVRPVDDAPVLLFGFPEQKSLFHGSILDLSEPWEFTTKNGGKLEIERQIAEDGTRRDREPNSDLLLDAFSGVDAADFTTGASLLYENTKELLLRENSTAESRGEKFPRYYRDLIEVRPGYYVYSRGLKPPIIWDNLVEIW
ncbi:unnamed protein product, partial [Amoebophrya sp. A120]|eukprot:GSA120T00019578001.1